MSTLSPRASCPLLSVIIPVFNRQDMILAALESVLTSIRCAQPLQNLNAEIVIVDDGSDPPITLDKLNFALPDFTEIRLIRRNKNEGVGSARNHGILNSRGNYLAFLDSDDKFLPNRFLNDLEFMTDYGVELCYGTTQDIYDENLDWEAPSRPAELTRFQAPTPKLGRALARGRHGHFHLNAVTINKQSLKNQRILFSRLKRGEDTLFLLECLDSLYSLPNPDTRPIASRIYHGNNSLKVNNRRRGAFLWASIFAKTSFDTKLAIIHNYTIRELKNTISAWSRN